MKPKTDKEKRDKKSNKTCFLRIRCSEEEKTRIQKRAERTGKKLSEFCREALLTGEIVAVPQLGEHEREAIRVLQRVSYFFSQDRKSTRLNSSHANISYAVFCLKKKKKK